MNSFDEALWKSLGNMRIAPAGAALTFEARLAREQWWSRTHADQVMREYRRFLYLAATTPGPVTPSQAVDEAWHLHLTYTRHYWGDLCANILRRPLHHDPSGGGPDEGTRYRDQYARTLTLYEATFGAAPPKAIWPCPLNEYSAESPRTAWPQLGVAAAATTLLAACVAQGGVGSGLRPGEWGVLLLIAAFVALVAVLATRRGGGKEKGDCGGGGCGAGVDAGGDGGGGGCGGGCGS